MHRENSKKSGFVNSPAMVLARAASIVLALNSSICMMGPDRRVGSFEAIRMVPFPRVLGRIPPTLQMEAHFPVGLSCSCTRRCEKPSADASDPLIDGETETRGGDMAVLITVLFHAERNHPTDSASLEIFYQGRQSSKIASQQRFMIGSECDPSIEPYRTRPH